jgi:AraC family transcriptional regulator
VTIIPAGSSARWDIPGAVDVIQLYLPHTTLERVAREADAPALGDLLERTGHPDAVTSGLLMSSADALEGNAALDALFRQRLTDLLADTTAMLIGARFCRTRRASQWQRRYRRQF